MKKILSIVLIVLMCGLGAVVSYANPYGNSTAFCVGTNYGLLDINTSSDATDAEYYYSIAGLSTIVNTTPTITTMNASHSNGQKCLASGIVFLSGHGNYNNMRFNYNGNGGVYNVGVWSGSSNTTNNSTYLYSLSNYSIDDTALYVFAGCLTAASAPEGEYNLPHYAINHGTKIAIGWTTEVNAGPHHNWLYRFNSVIPGGSTVNSAISYANSYAYLDNRVKNCLAYGYSNYNPLDFIEYLTRFSDNLIERLPDRRYENINEKDILPTIHECMKSLFGENVCAFEEEINGNTQYAYYDYVLYSQDVRTNVGITFEYSTKDKTLLMFNNMKGHSINSIQERIQYLKPSNREISDVQMNEYAKYTDSIDGVYRINQFVYYDVDLDEMLSAFAFDAQDADGLYYSDVILNRF